MPIMCIFLYLRLGILFINLNLLQIMEKWSDLEIFEFRLYENHGSGLTLLQKSKTLQPLLLASRDKICDILGILSDGTKIFVGHINLL